jgi:hypothetical protein
VPGMVDGSAAKSTGFVSSEAEESVPTITHERRQVLYQPQTTNLLPFELDQLSSKPGVSLCKIGPGSPMLPPRGLRTN